MCLKINKTFHPDNQPFMADRDIFVIKILEARRNHISLVHYTSPFLRFEYLMECPTTKVELIPICDCKVTSYVEDGSTKTEYRDVVNEGYHSYYHLAGFNKPMFGLLACLAVIPKGTKYFIGESNDIVSEQIKVIDPNTNDSYDKEFVVNATRGDYSFTSKELAATYGTNIVNNDKEVNNYRIMLVQRFGTDQDHLTCV